MQSIDLTNDLYSSFANDHDKNMCIVFKVTGHLGHMGVTPDKSNRMYCTF